MICSSHFLPSLLISHLSFAGSSHVLPDPALVQGHRDEGLEWFPFLSLPSSSRLHRSIHALPSCGAVSLGWGQWGKPRDRGRNGSSSLRSGWPQAPGAPLGETPQHYHSITVTATSPLPMTPPPSVTPTSGSEPGSDQITMMSIWGWVGEGGSGRGWNQLFLYFVLYVFFNM